MRVKSPSEAWTLLKSMVKSDNSYSPRGRKKGSGQHAVSVGEFAREYLARAKGSATAVRYHGAAVNEETCRRILIDLPPHMHFVREGFVLGMDFPVVKLEHALVKVGKLKKRPDGSDGHALAAGFKPKNHHDRGGQGGGGRS